MFLAYTFENFKEVRFIIVIPDIKMNVYVLKETP